MRKFKTGERVRIANPSTIGHTRVPTYVRGKIGIVERELDDYLIPEDEAFGRHPKGRIKPLYRIRIQMSDLWPEYRGLSGLSSDTLDLEIFEHWLQKV